jgi:hypothetical protein
MMRSERDFLTESMRWQSAFCMNLVNAMKSFLHSMYKYGMYGTRESCNGATCGHRRSRDLSEHNRMQPSMASLCSRL